MKQRFLLVPVFSLLMTLQAQAVQSCNPAIPADTPSSDFVVHNDGTVTHSRTGLMWKVCSEGQSWSVAGCAGTATTHSWDLALQIPASLNVSGGYAGYSDWRLPNVNELKSIVEYSCDTPAINATIFPATVSGGYWSCSPSASLSYPIWGASDSLNAWGVVFSYGYGDGHYPRHFRHGLNQLRLVRGGQ